MSFKLHVSTAVIQTPMVLLTVRALPKSVVMLSQQRCLEKPKKSFPPCKLLTPSERCGLRSCQMRWAKAAKQGQLANLKTAGHGQQTYHPSLPFPSPTSPLSSLRGMHGSCSELIQHRFIFFCMNWSVGKKL